MNLENHSCGNIFCTLSLGQILVIMQMVTFSIWFMALSKNVALVMVNIYGQRHAKRDLRTYAKSVDPDQPPRL